MLGMLTVVGGWIFTSVIPLNAQSAKKPLIALAWIWVFLECLVFFTGCHNNNYRGVTFDTENYNTTQVINDCNCKEGKFDKICDKTGETFYLTACHAQCESYSESENGTEGVVRKI